MFLQLVLNYTDSLPHMHKLMLKRILWQHLGTTKKDQGNNSFQYIETVTNIEEIKAHIR